MINFEELTFDDEKTWDLIGTGRTKGVFQLESNLGKSWAKKIQPHDIEELSALISLIRPGCLKAFSDDKNMTQHYADRKNGVDQPFYIHDALEPILAPTKGVLIYQETAIKLATELAGFTLVQADILRKAIGKKKADIMAKVKTEFLEGCKKVGIIPTDVAEEVFGWIEESQKYSFNFSHGVGYAIMAYWSAYLKANYPVHFFTAWLQESKNKPKPLEEINELVNDARSFGIDIFTPKFHMVLHGDIGDFVGYIHQ